MRNDEQKVKQEPLMLVFGQGDNAKTFPVKLLTMGKASEWRTQFIDVMDKVLAPVLTEQATTVNFTSAMMQFPEKLTDMVFAYASTVNRAEVVEIATDEQMAMAFTQVWEVAYPFLTHLGNVLKMVQANKSQK